ncbi:MAG: SRPBCC family protein [Chloroflexi bacterium]|uniref:SRPBCC family protein n=1 Tax=Candidatus Flexifilum breve TaxID=3140694 RepID=UPI00313674C1|nr:SRPBCC family protein [Chloroflexota bacterium]
MQIDTNAPVTARDSILIHAPLERVWALQANIEQWTQWQPNINRAVLEGELKAGSVFRWKAQGLAITSTLQVVDPCHQIGWTGGSLGMKAIHLWHFEATPEGTRVTVEESLSGWFTRLLAWFDRAFLTKSIASSLALLKAQAEKST